MLLHKFDFHEPKTSHEAYQILSGYGTKARNIAGGTDLMVNMKKKLLSPEHLVSISRIADLQKLDISGDPVNPEPCDHRRKSGNGKTCRPTPAPAISTSASEKGRTAIQADGRSIQTIEGLDAGLGLHPVQEAFVEKGAIQCGFCSSGMIR